MDILFEFKGSKSSMKCKRSQIKELIYSKLEALGHSIPNPKPHPSTSTDDFQFILQRYCSKWETFIDVDATESIVNGDRLSITLIPEPLSRPQKDLGQKAESIISEIKKPTQAEAKALAAFFPGSKRRVDFDPSAESIVLSRQKKKKAAIKRQRSTTISVIMLEKYSSTIPKGILRKRMAAKGKIQGIKFTREMSFQEVKNKIIRAFEVDTFVVLDCDGHNLIKCAEQSINGEKVVDRKGGLYLCKEFDRVSSSNFPIYSSFPLYTSFPLYMTVISHHYTLHTLFTLFTCHFPIISLFTHHCIYNYHNLLSIRIEVGIVALSYLEGRKDIQLNGIQLNRYSHASSNRHSM